MKSRQPGAEAAARVEQARAEARAAEQERNRRFVEAVGDAEPVPLELAEEYGLTGREAVHIVNAARSGTRAMRSRLFGN
ncbi:hypothetical protein [Nocardia sp. CA-290969]|uniref:hypothetical protein n=1 Tax=Nocardia sp. CA-290969 TaxID=3239986 RepID=UPI003D8CD5B4